MMRHRKAEERLNYRLDCQAAWIREVEAKSKADACRVRFDWDWDLAYFFSLIVLAVLDIVIAERKSR
jgi:hypothetical protein